MEEAYFQTADRGEKLKSPARGGPLYTLRGTVVHGRGLGHTVGMPTVNLRPDPGERLPCEGVYATICLIDGCRYMGLTNIGRRPTVESDGSVQVETFILDFSGDLYGAALTLEVYFRIRDIQKFASLEAVRAQVRLDEAVARRELAAYL